MDCRESRWESSTITYGVPDHTDGSGGKDVMSEATPGVSSGLSIQNDGVAINQDEESVGGLETLLGVLI